MIGGRSAQWVKMTDVIHIPIVITHLGLKLADLSSVSRFSLFSVRSSAALRLSMLVTLRWIVDL